MNPRVIVRRARFLTVAIALGCALYLGSRFEFLTLPADGCSPVSRYAPGSRILVDRWAEPFMEGDCVFVTDASGVVHLGTLGAASERGLWHVLGDTVDCPGLFPAEEDPVSDEAILGRVVLSLSR